MKYFTLEELCATKTELTNIPTWQAVENLKALVNNVLDPLRESWGKPIIVTSGFRCKAVNDKVGGVATSQHTKGEAADITALSVAENRKIFELIKKHTFFDQLKLSKGGSFIHVSFRASKNRLQVLEAD